MVVKSIPIDVEGDIMAGVCHQDIHSQNRFHDFESLIHFRGPTKLFLTRFVREGFKQMGLFKPHEPVCIVSTKDNAQTLEGVWWFLLKDGRNTFFPWLETNWCQPVSKLTGFLDSPLTLEGVGSEAICFKAI